jgi:hypothetical protein
MELLKKLYKIFSILATWALLGVFIKWFYDGLRGKYWYVFAGWLVFGIFFFIMALAKANMETEDYDRRTGAEVWEAKYH